MESSSTGNGDTVDHELQLKVQESAELFTLLSGAESKLNSRGSAITPAFVRDVSGVVFKRPSNSTEQDPECSEPPTKLQVTWYIATASCPIDFS